LDPDGKTVVVPAPLAAIIAAMRDVVAWQQLPAAFVSRFGVENESAAERGPRVTVIIRTKAANLHRKGNFISSTLNAVPPRPPLLSAIFEFFIGQSATPYR
jgi:hypothetical protein